MEAPTDAVAAHESPDVTSRPLLGLAFGVIAGLIAAVAWFLASVGTKSTLVYLCVAVGIAVGYAVNTGARRGTALTAVIAVVLTLVASSIGFYFVSRASLIRRGYVRLTDDGPSIPMVGSYQVVRDVIRVSLSGNFAPYLYLLVALAAAGSLGLRGIDTGKRRASS